MYWQQSNLKTDEIHNIPVSAKVVLMTKDGKVLLMRKSSGIVDLPGGKVEKNEDLYDALKREIKEETGLKAKKFKFVTSWVKTNKSLGDRLVIVFQARVKEKAKSVDIKLSKEHSWAEFLCRDGVDEIGDMPLGFANAIELSFNRYEARS